MRKIWYQCTYDEMRQCWKPPKTERFYNQGRKLRPAQSMKAATNRMTESPAFHRLG